MSMRMKAKKKPNVRKKHINVKVLGVKFLAWEKLKVLRGKKLQTEERFSARDIRFLAEEFDISRINILRGKPEIGEYFEGVESMHNKGKGCRKGCVTK